MPIGPQGQKRPVSVVESAVLICRIATGQQEEQFVNGKPRRKRHRGETDKLAQEPIPTSESGTVAAGS